MSLRLGDEKGKVFSSHFAMLLIHSQADLRFFAPVLACLALPTLAMTSVADDAVTAETPTAVQAEATAFRPLSLYLAPALGSQPELAVIGAMGGLHEGTDLVYETKIVPASDPAEGSQTVMKGYRIEGGEQGAYRLAEVGEWPAPNKALTLPGWLIRFTTKINHGVENPQGGSAFCFPAEESDAQVSRLPVQGLPEGMIIEQCSLLPHKGLLVLNVCSFADSTSFLALVDATTGQVVGDLIPSASPTGEPIAWNNFFWLDDDHIASVRGALNTKLCQVFSLKEKKFLFDHMVEAPAGDPIVHDGAILLVDPAQLEAPKVLLRLKDGQVESEWPAEASHSHE
jgi:hypothetical protein